METLLRHAFAAAQKSKEIEEINNELGVRDGRF
jgi:hypothetical protein